MFWCRPNTTVRKVSVSKVDGSAKVTSSPLYTSAIGNLIILLFFKQQKLVSRRYGNTYSVVCSAANPSAGNCVLSLEACGFGTRAGIRTSGSAAFWWKKQMFHTRSEHLVQSCALRSCHRCRNGGGFVVNTFFPAKSCPRWFRVAFRADIQKYFTTWNMTVSTEDEKFFFLFLFAFLVDVYPINTFAATGIMVKWAAKE